MIGTGFLRSVLAFSCVLLIGGCAFQGVNSLALPGTEGRGAGAALYHIEIANVGTLELNSPVLIADVTVGSIRNIRVKDYYAEVDVSVRPGVIVPANAHATIGQTSLLGSSHLALDPPAGRQPDGRLDPGATIPLDESYTYPSTEQTLASLSALVNAGGLGQIGDIIGNLNTALSGNEGQFRDLLTHLNRFIGTFDAQRADIVSAMQELNRLTITFNHQDDVLTQALRRIPPGLEVLVQERPDITQALQRLGVFSDTATEVVLNSKADLVANLKNLDPTIRSLADVGPELNKALQLAFTYPLPQNLIDRGLRGDYMNLFATFDITVPRLKRGLLLGTRWGQEGAQLVPAPGDPGYEQYYNTNPLAAGIAPPPQGATPPAPPPPSALPPVPSADSGSGGG